MNMERIYQPELSQTSFDEAYQRSHDEARLLVIYEAGRIARFIGAVLKKEGYGLLSFGKRSRRKQLFRDALGQLHEVAPKLGPFGIQMESGMVTHVDHVKEAKRNDRLAQRKIEAAQVDPDQRLMNHLTGEIVTADKASMEILFGRARLGDFEEVS